MDISVTELPQANDKVQVSVSITAELNVSSHAAKRHVTGYLLDNVSDHLGCDAPQFLIERNHFFWRVPVILYLTLQGRVGPVGHIDIDAFTGKLLITPQLIADLKNNATELAQRSAH